MPNPNLALNVEALSGICGSISLACWVVVFSPQIIENFRRGSADGLSLIFIVTWLAGDVFNILGAVLQGVLPTMIILAVYYTLADLVLLGQCFYYRGFTLSDAPSDPETRDRQDEEEAVTEETPLLGSAAEDSNRTSTRRRSSISVRAHLREVHGAHLSPATPLLPPAPSHEAPATRNLKPASTIQAFCFNLSALILVCGAGVFGWWLSTRSGRHGYSSPPRHSKDPKILSDDVEFDLWGQIFGYLCAVLYLGSRIPQLLLNYRRKSVEGVSMLFFLFACVGNLTYVMSIMAYEPECAKDSLLASRSGRCTNGKFTEQYGRYILVNASWLIGSAGTLFLDLAIFGQFWVYRGNQPVMA